MQKENKDKIKSSIHARNSDSSSITSKRYRTMLPRLATMLALLMYMTAAAPYAISNTALAFNMEKMASIAATTSTSSPSNPSLSTNASVSIH